MSKGDVVVAIVDTGGGSSRVEVVARAAGRRVEVTHARGIVEVSEMTRTNQPVRTARFMANRVISVVEYPAGMPVE